MFRINLLANRQLNFNKNIRISYFELLHNVSNSQQNWRDEDICVFL